MRIRVPITGTVKQVDPCIIGDTNDIIRPITSHLGNVKWTFVSMDLDAEEMEIEVTPSEIVEYDTGAIDGEGNTIWDQRTATPAEKDALIENARNHSLERMSKQALYDLSGSPRLENPFKEIP